MSENSRELNSWKEIAAYLGVSVRAAQLWEVQRSLPVRRLAGPRARVLAYTDELEHWKQQNANLRVPISEPLPEKATRFGTIPAILSIALVLAALVIARQPFSDSAPRLENAKPLAVSRLREINPALSPNTAYIAFLQSVENRPEFELRIRSREGQESKLLASDLAVEDRFAWSPQSNAVAVLRLSPSGPEIQIIDVNGLSSIRTIPLNSSYASRQVTMEARSLAWMKNGQNLCFSHSALEGTASLYTIDLKSLNLHQLTLPPETISGDFQCTPSPDGSKIAFVRQQSNSEGDLFVLDLSSGQLRRLTHLRAHFSGLAWHPNKDALIFASRFGTAKAGLWFLKLDGSAAQRLSGNEVHASFPSMGVSQGEVHLAYQTTVKDLNIYAVSGSSNPRRISESALTDHYPAVSAKGEVAWISHHSGFPELWLQPAGATSPLQLTNYGGGYLDFPRWSPDDRLIAFSAPVANGRGVVILDVAKRQVRPLIRNPVDEGRANFSRDGRFIYFRSPRSGTPEIWKLAHAELGATPVQVTRGGAYEAQEDFGEQYLYFVRSRNNPGLYRQPVKGGTAELIDSTVWEGRWGLARDSVIKMSGTRDGSIAIERAPLKSIPLSFQRIFQTKLRAEAGISVSPDGNTVYISLLDLYDSDIYTALLR